MLRNIFLTPDTIITSKENNSIMVKTNTSKSLSWLQSCFKNRIYNAKGSFCNNLVFFSKKWMPFLCPSPLFFELEHSFYPIKAYPLFLLPPLLVLQILPLTRAWKIENLWAHILVYLKVCLQARCACCYFFNAKIL